MIKKQKTLIIVFVSLFVLLTVSYFLVIKPLLTVTDDDKTPAEYLPGEVPLNAANENFYIFEPIKRSSIQSIEVENEFGGYKIYRDAADRFQLEGCTGLNFNEELFSNLVVSSGTPTAIMRVGYDLSDEKLAEYGFDSPQASWTITTTSGDKVKMLVGYELLTEGGYYVMLEGRNAVYIVNSNIGLTVLQPASALLKPLLSAGMTQNDYFTVNEFTIWHGDELFVNITRVPDSEKKDPEAIVEVILNYPYSEASGEVSRYELNDNLYFEALYSLITLEGESVVAFMPDDETIRSYGLESPKYTVVYEYNGYQFYIFVSELQPDGSYYAASNLFNFLLICKVPGSAISWLEASRFEWLFPTPFFVDITTVSRIKIKSENVDVDYRLSHGMDSQNSATLEVVEVNSNTKIPNSDVRNFREYYKTMLHITNQEYAKMSKSDLDALIADESKVIMTMEYEGVDGSSCEYKFYKYYEASSDKLSGGKVLVTVNGIGEFYTTNDLVNKILNDTPRVLEGLDVDAYGKQ